jgi:endogenous inhibitor of DNA gyrase (YacG/DUF329 family)
MTTCLTEDCTLRVYAKRLCEHHYNQARYKGDLPLTEAVDRPCAFCGEKMANRQNNRAKFCSLKCKEADRVAQRRIAAEAKKVDRKCQKCDTPLPASMSSRAKFCSTKCNMDWQNAAKSTLRAAEKVASRKPCLHCGSEIPESRRSNANYCSRECMRVATRAKAYDSEKARDYNRNYHYGIGTTEFEAILASQGGRCAICRTNEWPGKDNKPHIDHCHKLGVRGQRVIRGILCTNCNQGLGRFKDSTDLLAAAIEYLNASSGEHVSVQSDGSVFRSSIG